MDRSRLAAGRVGIRLFARLARPALRRLDELIRIHYAGSRACAPLFIIGPPRSGTTLLYQVLVNRYGFSYFSNFSANFPQAPILALWIEDKLLPNSIADLGYASKYGKTEGWYGPHECGEFWYRWFPRGKHVYVAPGTTPKEHLTELAGDVAAMSKVTQSPVIFKNVYNSMRIAPIVEACPQASFLVCRRNLLDTAQSILSSRMDSCGNKTSWWSLPPKEIDEIERHAYWEQVVEQAYYTYEQISEDVRRFGEGRFLDVEYEEVCRDTHGALDNIERFLVRRGVGTEPQGDVPSEFQMSTGRRVSEEDYQRIKAAIAALEDSRAQAS